MTEGTPPSPGQPQPGQQQPPPYGRPFGQPSQPGQPPASEPTPPAYSPPPSYEQPAYGQQQPTYGQQLPTRDPERRPGTVLAAAILTWVFAGMAAIGSVFTLFAVNVDREAVVDDLERELEGDEDFEDLGWRGEDIADALNVSSVVVIVLSVLAIVLAVMAFRRSKGGRIGLVVMSSITGLLCLATFWICVPLLWLLAAGATIVLLFTGGANAWYARRESGQPAHPQPGDYGQWPQA